MLASLRLAIGGLLAWLAPVVALAAGNNWMGGLDGATRLSQLSIPGTHDSGARYENWPGTAICQTATIAEQLNMGVRVLDLRCRHINDAFAIHHGSVYQNLSFEEVLSQVYAFLDSNSTECVIVSVKEEYTARKNTRSFEATFDWYVSLNPSKWWLGTTVPNLNSVRGKTVLLRRFNASSAKGLDATYWPDNQPGGFSANNLSVQDWYQVTNKPTKWNYVVNSLVAARDDTNANVLHLNFSSGYEHQAFGIPNIGYVANYINPRLSEYFSSAPRGHYGCVLMDFADATRASLIYSANPPRVGVYKLINKHSGKSLNVFNSSTDSDRSVFKFADPQAASFNRRFYRVRFSDLSCPANTRF